MPSVNADTAHWYFAYGSNLLRQQFIARTAPFHRMKPVPRIARLLNFRLAFNMLGDDGEVYANVVSPGAGVSGVAYACVAEALAELDAYEIGYRRQVLTVTDLQGLPLQAHVYIAKAHTLIEEGRPSDRYLQRILSGARQQGLSEEYINGIATLAAGV